MGSTDVNTGNTGNTGSANYVQSSSQQPQKGVFDPKEIEKMCDTLSNLLIKHHAEKKAATSGTTGSGVANSSEQADQTIDAKTDQLENVKQVTDNDIADTEIASTTGDATVESPFQEAIALADELLGITIPPPPPSKPPLAPPPPGVSGGGGSFPSGTGGADNAWLLHPSMTGILFNIIMESNFASLQGELQEGLQTAETMTRSNEAAIAEGTAIIQSAAAQATEKMVSAGVAFGTAAVEFGTAAATAGAETMAKRSMAKDTKEMEDNPKCKTSATGKDDVDKYVGNKRDIKKLEDKAATGKLTKSEQSTLDKLKKQNENIKPGTKQWESYFQKKGGIDPTTGGLKAVPGKVNQEDIDEYKSQTKLVAARKDPSSSEAQKALRQKTERITQTIHAMSQGIEQMGKGIDSLTQGTIAIMKAAYDQQKTLLENRKEQLSHLMNAAQTNKKMFADALAGTWQMLKQISSAETQYFSFTRARG